MKAHTLETQSSLTPYKALQFLKEGNQRFMSNLKVNRNLLEQVNDTKNGQFPFAIILSCIDSRTSAELIFDQGLGDIFSVRIAGNILNDDIIGSMEFACKVAGSKLVVVLGHSKCGAIKGACSDVKMGHLTGLLDKIKPSVKQATANKNSMETTPEFVEEVAQINVIHSMDEILKRSDVLKTMFDNGEVGFVGGYYDVETGEVEFLKEILHD
ncbi:carbonic anhydrase family protein [Flavobacterium sp.]|uniref:carbonic anhydrase family protein n=1 Tax=Flavobacterium sp. TaxID=239 RepID=UPI002FDB7030